MMKQILYTFLLACLATACSDEHEPGSVQSSGSGDALVPLEIASATVEGEASTVTRAGAVTTLASGSIGVFLTGKDDPTTYMVTDNCEYTYNGTTGKWAASNSDATIYLSGEDANVCAYYPYKNAVTHNDETAIPLTTQEYAAEEDLSFAVNNVVNGTSTQRAVTFAMTHAYSQIQLKITRENYPTTCAISAITLENSNLATKATIDITDGTVSGTTTGNYSLTFATSKTLGTSETYTRSLLMVPVASLPSDTEGKSLKISLTVDGQIMSTGIPAADLPALIRGEKYVIALKIKGKEISATGVTAASWTDSPVNSGTEYEPKPAPAP